MSDVDLVIRHSKRLEALLVSAGASGRGLHEKTRSLGDRLPQATRKKLHFVATLRNKLLHDDAYRRLDDRAGFVRAAREAEKEIKLALGRKQLVPRWVGWLIATLLITLLSLFMAWYLEAL